jgi:hypothetical protein
MGAHKNSATVTIRLPLWAIEFLDERAGDARWSRNKMLSTFILARIEQIKRKERRSPTDTSTPVD